MNNLGVWLFGLSLLIGIGSEWKIKNPKVLDMYRFKHLPAWKTLADPEEGLQGFCHHIARYEFARGFAWGVMACSMLVLLSSN